MIRIANLFAFAVAVGAVVNVPLHAVADECWMEVVDVSDPIQYYSSCSCEDEITVDFQIEVTCCDCFDGETRFSKVVPIGPDGPKEKVVTYPVSIPCNCRNCTKDHSIECVVHLEERVKGDRPGDISEGATEDQQNDNKKMMLRAAGGVSPFTKRDILGGAPTVLIGLGHDSSGNYSGHLKISPTCLVDTRPISPAIVTISGNTRTGIESLGNPEIASRRQVDAAECFVDMVACEDPETFEIRYYLPGKKAADYSADGWLQPVSNAVPFVTYRVSPGELDGNRRGLRIVEIRSGAVLSVRELVVERTAGGVMCGIRKGEGAFVRGVERDSNGRLYEVVRSDSGYEHKIEKSYVTIGGIKHLVQSVESDGTGSVQTNRWEYVLDSEANGYGLVAAEISPAGLRTEYTYDSEDRVIKEKTIAPAGGIVRERVASYSPLGVRPHCPVFENEIDVPDDAGTADVGTPRMEVEYIGGIAVSKILRFISIDKMNHRIVEEVEVKDLASANLSEQWNSASNPKTYTDYMPYDRCKPCSKLPYLVRHANGTIDRYEYLSGEYHPSADGGPGVFIPTMEGNGAWFKKSVTHYPASGVAVANRTTKESTIEIRSSKDVLLQEEFVFVGGASNAFERLSWTSTTRDDSGNEILVVRSDGTRTEKQYEGGRLALSVDEDGIPTSYRYDGLGRIISETEGGVGLRPDKETTWTYDPEDRILATTVMAGQLSETETSVYDGFGREIESEGKDGIVTRTFYALNSDTGYETVTSVRGFGTDCAVTNTTVSSADRMEHTSILNGVVRSVSKSGVDTDGCQWEKTYSGPNGTDSSRWKENRRDTLGRVVEERAPGYGGSIVTVSNLYDSVGRLVATRRYAGAPSLLVESKMYGYDEFGNRVISVSDLNLNGTVDWNDSDRISSNSTAYAKIDGDWWNVSTAYSSQESGTSELMRVGESRSRMTGLGDDGLESESVSIDRFGNETYSRSFRNRETHSELDVVSAPQSSLDSISVSVCGLVVTNISNTGVRQAYEYDALGRQAVRIDGRGNRETTAYDAAGRVIAVSDGAGNTTTFGYDALGRQVVVSDPLGLEIVMSYDADDQMVSQRGATYPVDYEYDAHGNKISMTTYRDEGLQNGDVTRWLYDEPTGLVTNKIYADGKGPQYAYTYDGKLAKRTWARGTETRYHYDVAGNLVFTDYSDQTPDISNAYDRAGRMVSNVSVGVATNLFRYSREGLLTNEWQNGMTITRRWDGFGRMVSLESRDADGSSRTVGYSYDELGRLASVDTGANVYRYSYLPGTDAVNGYRCGRFEREIYYEPNRDLISAVTNRFDNRVVSSFEYLNDAAGRRVEIRREGESMRDLAGSIDRYGYNGRNEVVSSRRMVDGNSVQGFSEDFEYDPIGNRKSSTIYDEQGLGRTSRYVANELNQYTQRIVPGWAAVRGNAHSNACVTVGGRDAFRVGEYYFGGKEFDNSTEGGYREVEVRAVLPGGEN